VFVNCALSVWPGKQSTAPVLAGLPVLFQQGTNPAGDVCACTRVTPAKPATITATIAIAIRKILFMVHPPWAKLETKLGEH
jgi:hypothetical protein